MEDEKYKKAKKRVRELKGFYTHLAIYIFVNVILIIINLVVSPNVLWFYWVTIFWGIAVLIQAFSLFSHRGVLTDEWEERKIKEILEKDKEE